jgi:hypothetical protein
MPRPPWSGQYESLYEPLGDDFCQSIVTDGEDMLTWLRNQVSSQLNHGDAPDSSVIELCILALNVSHVTVAGVRTWMSICSMREIDGNWHERAVRQSGMGKSHLSHRG